MRRRQAAFADGWGEKREQTTTYYVVEVCGNLRSRHGENVTRTQASAHLYYVISRYIICGYVISDT